MEPLGIIAAVKLGQIVVVGIANLAVAYSAYRHNQAKRKLCEHQLIHYKPDSNKSVE